MQGRYRYDRVAWVVWLLLPMIGLLAVAAMASAAVPVLDLPLVRALRSDDANPDPLQRCLRDPDPPGVHWARAAVDAYCRMQTLTVPSLAQVSVWLRNGQTQLLDRQYAAYALQEHAHPAVPALEVALWKTFDDPSPVARTVADLWLLRAPHSAIAATASAIQHFAQAVSARGDRGAAHTTPAQLHAMVTDLQLAAGDLHRATAADARLPEIYVVYMRMARLVGASRVLDAAAKRALRLAPADYYVYDAMMKAEQPRWGGSVAGMLDVAEQADSHLSESPALAFVTAKPAGYAGLVAHWHQDDARALPLLQAGIAAGPNAEFLRVAAGICGDRNDLATMLIDDAQRVRFDPRDIDALDDRAQLLASMGDDSWALRDLGRALAQRPDDIRALQLASGAEQRLHHYADSEATLQHLLVLQPDNEPALTALVQEYLYLAPQREKARPYVERLLKLQPTNAGYWMDRAQCYAEARSPEFYQSLHQFLRYARADTPAERATTARIRQFLATNPPPRA